MSVSEMARVCARAVQAYPASKNMQGAFRLGAHSAWKGKTVRHCPYGDKAHGELGYRNAWLDGYAWAIMQNDLSTKECFG